MSKGFAVTAIIAFVLVVFFLLLVVGIAGNWKPVSGDIFGIITFFNAIRDTFGNFITVTNTLLWTMLFFATEGIFLYAYYKIARLIWVHVPQFQAWFKKSKDWFSRY